MNQDISDETKEIESRLKVPYSPDDWIILETLVPIILKHRKGCVVEIGIGRSTLILARLAEEAGVNFYTCDINPKKINEYQFQLEAISCTKTKQLIYCLPSNEFMKKFDMEIKERPAVVFIDGSHEFKIVMAETSFFMLNLLEGGIMFLHDTLPPSEEYVRMDYLGLGDVYRVRQVYERTGHRYDCFTWPYTAQGYGLTMILKKPTNRPYYQL